MKKFADVKRLPEFERELKKLLKKFQSLEDDLKTFEAHQLYPFHKLNVNNNGIVRIEGLGIEEPRIYKAKKFACKSLKGRGVQSGIRVTYAYSPTEDVIELIEVYFKADTENEDRGRIKSFLKKHGCGWDN